MMLLIFFAYIDLLIDMTFVLVVVDDEHEWLANNADSYPQFLKRRYQVCEIRIYTGMILELAVADDEHARNVAPLSLSVVPANAALRSTIPRA